MLYHEEIESLFLSLYFGTDAEECCFECCSSLFLQFCRCGCLYESTSIKVDVLQHGFIIGRMKLYFSIYLQDRMAEHFYDLDNQSPEI